MVTRSVHQKPRLPLLSHEHKQPIRNTHEILSSGRRNARGGERWEEGRRELDRGGEKRGGVRERAMGGKTNRLKARGGEGGGRKRGHKGGEKK